MDLMQEQERRDDEELDEAFAMLQYGARKRMRQASDKTVLTHLHTTLSLQVRCQTRNSPLHIVAPELPAIKFRLALNDDRDERAAGDDVEGSDDDEGRKPPAPKFTFLDAEKFVTSLRRTFIKQIVRRPDQPRYFNTLWEAFLQPYDARAGTAIFDRVPFAGGKTIHEDAAVMPNLMLQSVGESFEALFPRIEVDRIPGTGNWFVTLPALNPHVGFALLHTLGLYDQKSTAEQLAKKPLLDRVLRPQDCASAPELLKKMFPRQQRLYVLNKQFQCQVEYVPGSVMLYFVHLTHARSLSWDQALTQAMQRQDEKALQEEARLARRPLELHRFLAISPHSTWSRRCFGDEGQASLVDTLLTDCYNNLSPADFAPSDASSDESATRATIILQRLYPQILEHACFQAYLLASLGIRLLRPYRQLALTPAPPRALHIPATLACLDFDCIVDDENRILGSGRNLVTAATWRLDIPYKQGTIRLGLFPAHDLLPDDEGEAWLQQMRDTAASFLAIYTLVPVRPNSLDEEIRLVSALQIEEVYGSATVSPAACKRASVLPEHTKRLAAYRKQFNSYLLLAQQRQGFVSATERQPLRKLPAFTRIETQASEFFARFARQKDEEEEKKKQGVPPPPPLQASDLRQISLVLQRLYELIVSPQSFPTLDMFFRGVELEAYRKAEQRDLDNVLAQARDTRDKVDDRTIRQKSLDKAPKSQRIDSFFTTASAKHNPS
jgi:hypothetical protein